MNVLPGISVKCGVNASHQEQIEKKKMHGKNNIFYPRQILQSDKTENIFMKLLINP
jgi:hypothetical protein